MFLKEFFEKKFNFEGNVQNKKPVQNEMFKMRNLCTKKKLLQNEMYKIRNLCKMKCTK